MIMPALPKTFYFATTFGEEWKEFWDGLWLRAARAIRNADELVIIGYSLPAADERARGLLLDTENKAVRLSIACGNATASLELEFRDHGFTNVHGDSYTFDDFLKSEATRDITGAGTPISLGTTHNPSTETLSRLNALAGKQGLLKIRFAGEVGFTFESVYPAPDLPAEADDDTIQTAITRSRFLVRFQEGTLIDGSEKRVISGRDISLVRGRY